MLNLDLSVLSNEKEAEQVQNMHANMLHTPCSAFNSKQGGGIYTNQNIRKLACCRYRKRGSSVS